MAKRWNLVDLLIAEVDAAVKKRAGGRFAVIGHRGKGMNALASPDRRLQEVKENSVRSFNEAARFPVDYVEFDVQVKITRDPRISPRIDLLLRQLKLYKFLDKKETLV